MQLEQPPQSSTQSQQQTFTVHFAEPLSEMNPISSSDFLCSLLTPQDNKVLSNYSLEQLNRFRSQNLVQLVAIEGAFSHQDTIFANKAEELSEPTKALAETQARLQESELISQERLSKLDKTLNKLRMVTTRNQQLAADNEDLKKWVTEVHDTGFREGVQSCRQRLLYALQGQRFLQTMHQDLLEAYHLSTDYLRHLGPPITWLTTEICITLAAQLKLDLKVVTDHVNKIIKNLCASPSFKGARPNPRAFLGGYQPCVKPHTFLLWRVICLPLFLMLSCCIIRFWILPSTQLVMLPGLGYMASQMLVLLLVRY